MTLNKPELPNNPKVKKAVTKLKAQLSTIIATMKKSPQPELLMRQWITRIETIAPGTRPACGFAACICGEQAMQGDFEVFPTEIENYSGADDWLDYAEEIHNNIGNLALAACVTDDLVQSAFGAALTHRQNLARLAMKWLLPDYPALGDLDRMADLDFLHADKPTPKQAVEYLEYILNVVNVIQETRDNE